MGGKDKTQTRATSATIVPINAFDEEEGSGWRAADYLPKRRGIIFCCGCIIVSIVILGFIALILALTAFRVKDPKLSILGIHVTGLKAAIGSNSSSVNATMTADVWVKNPNKASFRMSNSTTKFMYREEVVGVASVPGGFVSAEESRRMNVTVPITTQNVTVDGPEGFVNITSFTEITGRVNLFGMFRRKLNVFINCRMTLDLSLNTQDVGNLVCGASTR
ncbi:late embryogenesis abundant protein At1g64065-like [Wolffia australiana]